MLKTSMHSIPVSIQSLAIKSNFSNNDYVTNCDLIIEKYIIDEIKNTYPDISIMSEELEVFNLINKQRAKNFFILIKYIRFAFENDKRQLTRKSIAFDFFYW